MTAVVPVVTCVRRAGAGRVAIELDGSPWRVLPVEAAARSGLDVGVVVDRPRARRVRTELRRSAALAIAARSLRYGDHSRQSLSERLGRSGVDAAAGEEALGTLEQLGLLDDARMAQDRAAALVERDAGDLLIRADLERRGFTPNDVAEAMATIEPEAARVQRIVDQHGASPRTLRRLLAKGFGVDALEALIADEQPNELG